MLSVFVLYNCKDLRKIYSYSKTLDHTRLLDKLKL